jgi:hypothetical protein
VRGKGLVGYICRVERGWWGIYVELSGIQKDPHSVEMIFELKINECLNSIIEVEILMLDSCFFVVVNFFYGFLSHDLIWIGPNSRQYMKINIYHLLKISVVATWISSKTKHFFDSGSRTSSWLPHPKSLFIYSTHFL